MSGFYHETCRDSGKRTCAAQENAGFVRFNRTLYDAGLGLPWDAAAVVLDFFMTCASLMCVTTTTNARPFPHVAWLCTSSAIWASTKPCATLTDDGHRPSIRTKMATPGSSSRAQVKLTLIPIHTKTGTHRFLSILRLTASNVTWLALHIRQQQCRPWRPQALRCFRVTV